jgi:hypothetical protein
LNFALHAPAANQAAVSMRGFYKNIMKKSSRKRENLMQEVGAENSHIIFVFLMLWKMIQWFCSLTNQMATEVSKTYFLCQLLVINT